MAQHEVDADLIRKLAELLDETNLTELEYAVDGLRVRVARERAALAIPLDPRPAPVAQPAAVAVPVAAPAEHPGTITSPMVGTAYLAAQPGSPAFVKAGDRVRAGQTLMIIEAMKVMNPIKAPVAGTVAEILAGDTKPVEFGETLIVIA